MISRVIKKTVDLDAVQKVDQLEGPLYQLEESGHTFEITCMSGGTAAAVSGTVSGRFLRADGVTQLISGTLSGNVVSITLTQNCYNVPGRFGLVVYVTGSDVSTAIYCAVGSVYRSTSDTVVDSGDIIPTPEQLQAMIEACGAATTAATAASAFVPNVVAPAYSDSATYTVGDYVTKDNYLYRCISDISTAENWTASHWTLAVTTGKEIQADHNALGDVNGGEIIQFTVGRYIDTSGNDISINSPSTSSNYAYALTACAPGDTFTLTGTGTNTAHYLWCFVTSEGKKVLGDVGHSGTNVTEKDLVLTSPATAAYLVCNVRLTGPYFLCKNKSVSVRVSGIENFLAAYANLNDAAAPYKNSSGKFDTTFSVSFRVNREPVTLGMTSQYTGSTVPTVSYAIDNGSTTLFTSPVYDLGSTIQLVTQELRVPPYVDDYNICTVTFTIPSGTVADITDIYLRDNVVNKPFDGGIWWQGHSGWTSMLPRDTVAGFQFGAKLGFNAMVTIPKFTADTEPIGVCFHDETSITIGGVSKPISGWTYAELCEYDLGSGMRIPTLDDFFRICANCNMDPILSVHSSNSYTEFWLEDTGVDRFTRIKAISDKYGLTQKLWIKCGQPKVLDAAFTVFGSNFGGIILLANANSSWGPLAQSKNIENADGVKFIPASATSVKEAAAPIKFEMFYNATYIDNITTRFAAARAADCECSIAYNAAALPGATIKQLISIGATGFCQDRHCSMGLDW